MQYAPYFCEENAVLLARDPALVVAGAAPPPGDRRVVFVTNADRTVATWAQRAGDPVVWDYHVVCLARGADGRWWVCDPDSTLGPIVLLPAWLAGSFRAGPPAALLPRFRVCTVAEIDATFASDRSHMRDAAGRPTRPFPSWPPLSCPAGGHTLPRFLDLADPVAGTWHDAAGLAAAFSR